MLGQTIEHIGLVPRQTRRARNQIFPVLLHHAGVVPVAIKSNPSSSHLWVISSNFTVGLQKMQGLGVLPLW